VVNPPVIYSHPVEEGQEGVGSCKHDPKRALGNEDATLDRSFALPSAVLPCHQNGISSVSLALPLPLNWLLTSSHGTAVFFMTTLGT
jgi:hypothetical protein